MKITRLGPDLLGFEDGREIQYEATWREVPDQRHGAYLENGSVVEEEAPDNYREVESLNLDPQVSRLEALAIEEFLNELPEDEKF